MWYTDLIICMLNTVSNMFLNPKTNYFILYMMEKSEKKTFSRYGPLKNVADSQWSVFPS